MAGQLVKRIVVGTDGSTHASAAMDWAIGLSRVTGAEIVAVHALYVPVYASSGFSPLLQYDPDWREEMERAFDEWCAPLKSSGVPFQKFLRDGRPAAVIADVAEAVHADLVVVGRRGRGTLAELMLGSVSHELSHHCKRPVVLISGPKTEKAAVRSPKVEVASAAQT